MGLDNMYDLVHDINKSISELESMLEENDFDSMCFLVCLKFLKV